MQSETLAATAEHAVARHSSVPRRLRYRRRGICRSLARRCLAGSARQIAGKPAGGAAIFVVGGALPLGMWPPQAQSQATQGRDLSTLAPLRALRARTSEPTWPQRAVGEGVKSCPRAGCWKSACPVR